LLAYSSIVIAPVLGLTLSSTSGAVSDATGHAWQVRDIQAVTALVGIFTVLPFWLLASSEFRVLRVIEHGENMHMNLSNSVVRYHLSPRLRQFRSGEQKRAHSIDITRGWLEFAGLATDRLNGSSLPSL